MMSDLSPEAQLLLLVMASHGGTMTKTDAIAEFGRVRAMTPEARAVWTVDAQEKVRHYAALRRQVDEG